MDGSRHWLGPGENISRTLADFGTPVTDFPGAEPCGYIIAGEGRGALFCDRPAVRGASYCARHRALCQVRPGTPEAAAIIADLAREAERPNRPCVSHDPIPEPLEETEPEEVLAALDLPGADTEGAA